MQRFNGKRTELIIFLSLFHGGNVINEHYVCLSCILNFNCSVVVNADQGPAQHIAMQALSPEY